MAVLIKDGEAERLIRELVDRTGESITDAVRLSVSERLSRLMPDSSDVARRKKRLRDLTAYLDGQRRADPAGEDVR